MPKFAKPKSFLQTPKHLKDWLDKKDEDFPVGFSHDVSSCPIACMLRHNNVKQPRVGVTLITFRNTETDQTNIFHCPEWVERFILQLDKLSPYKTTVTKGQVQKALELSQASFAKELLG